MTKRKRESIHIILVMKWNRLIKNREILTIALSINMKTSINNFLEKAWIIGWAFPSSESRILQNPKLECHDSKGGKFIWPQVMGQSHSGSMRKNLYPGTLGCVCEVYVRLKWILCLDLGPLPKISYCMYANIPVLEHFCPQACEVSWYLERPLAFREEDENQTPSCPQRHWWFYQIFKKWTLSHGVFKSGPSCPLSMAVASWKPSQPCRQEAQAGLTDLWGHESWVLMDMRPWVGHMIV